MTSETMRNRKLLYILLALLAALAMWLYVDRFGNNGGPMDAETTVTGIPITYVGQDALADRGLMLMEEGTTATVDLTFIGPRTAIAHLSRENIHVVADLSAVESAGAQNLRYDVAFDRKNITSGMITERSPSTAAVNITELNSKTVDVVCELVGNVAEGFSAGELQLSQETVEIRGQEEDIGAVSYVKVTLDIGKDAKESVSQSLNLAYYDENDQVLDGGGIHPTADAIQATLPVFVTKELQLVVDFKEFPGLREENLKTDISPSTITVSGDAGKLRDINSITLGELNLLDLLASGAKSHTFPIIIPEGCDNLSGVTRATVKVEFVDMDHTQVSTEKFTYANLPAGKSVEILTQQLTVSIFGTSADVAAVTGDQITVEADLANYSGASGTYTVPATIRINTGGDVGVSGTYNVQVTIQNTPDTPVEPEPEPEPGPEPETGE